MPSTFVPKVDGVLKVTPSRVWMSFSAFAAGASPSASTRARCTMAIVTAPSGSNAPLAAVNHPWSAATAA